jgi:hypothetical protein
VSGRDLPKLAEAFFPNRKERQQRKASKKQMITRPGTLEIARYVIVFTTGSSGWAVKILEIVTVCFSK